MLRCKQRAAVQILLTATCCCILADASPASKKQKPMPAPLKVGQYIDFVPGLGGVVVAIDRSTASSSIQASATKAAIATANPPNKKAHALLAGSWLERVAISTGDDDDHDATATLAHTATLVSATAASGASGSTTAAAASSRETPVAVAAIDLAQRASMPAAGPENGSGSGSWLEKVAISTGDDDDATSTLADPSGVTPVGSNEPVATAPAAGRGQVSFFLDGCTAHTDCAVGSFCRFDNRCDSCKICVTRSFAIDGRCPTTCVAVHPPLGDDNSSAMAVADVSTNLEAVDEESARHGEPASVAIGFASVAAVLAMAAALLTIAAVYSHRRTKTLGHASVSYPNDPVETEVSPLLFTEPLLLLDVSDPYTLPRPRISIVSFEN